MMIVIMTFLFFVFFLLLLLLIVAFFVIDRPPIYLNMLQDGRNVEERQSVTPTRRGRRTPTAPHVNHLKHLYHRLMELLPPVIDSVFAEMQRNNSLTDEQINGIGRQETPEETAIMMLIYLMMERQLAYNGFVQALKALRCEDILAVLGIDDRIDPFSIV